MSLLSTFARWLNRSRSTSASPASSVLEVHWSDDRIVADLAGTDHDAQRWDDDGGALAAGPLDELEEECFS